MMSENKLIEIASSEIARIFGKKYLKDNYDDSCIAAGFIQGKIYQLFIGIKSKKDLPDRKANKKGWVVYGLIWLDALTGELVKKEYVLE